MATVEDIIGWDDEKPDFTIRKEEWKFPEATPHTVMQILKKSFINESRYLEKIEKRLNLLIEEGHILVDTEGKIRFTSKNTEKSVDNCKNWLTQNGMLEMGTLEQFTLFDQENGKKYLSVTLLNSRKAEELGVPSIRYTPNKAYTKKGEVIPEVKRKAIEEVLDILYGRER